LVNESSFNPELHDWLLHGWLSQPEIGLAKFQHNLDKL